MPVVKKREVAIYSQTGDLMSREGVGDEVVFDSVAALLLDAMRRGARQSAGWMCEIALASDGRREVRRSATISGSPIKSPYSERWTMCPDYGGAFLWNERGANTDASGKLSRLSADKARELESRLSQWQAEFENRVDEDDEAFEWGAFHSKGMVLAQALSDASDRVVFYEEPFEQTGRSDAERWMSWGRGAGAEEPPQAELGRALCALDEARALELIERDGAPAGGLMEPGISAALLCAHLGFDQAMAAILKRRPEQAHERDGYGCSPLDAAVGARSAACARVLRSLGANPLEPDRDGFAPLVKAFKMARWAESAEVIKELALGLSERELPPGLRLDLSACAPKAHADRARAGLEAALLEGALAGAEAHPHARSL